MDKHLQKVKNKVTRATSADFALLCVLLTLTGICIRDHSQQTITCLNSTIEILEKGVKYIQN